MRTQNTSKLTIDKRIKRERRKKFLVINHFAKKLWKLKSLRALEERSHETFPVQCLKKRSYVKKPFVATKKKC